MRIESELILIGFEMNFISILQRELNDLEILLFNALLPMDQFSVNNNFLYETSVNILYFFILKFY